MELQKLEGKTCQQPFKNRRQIPLTDFFNRANYFVLRYLIDRIDVIEPLHAALSPCRPVALSHRINTDEAGLTLRIRPTTYT